MVYLGLVLACKGWQIPIEIKVLQGWDGGVQEVVISGDEQGDIIDTGVYKKETFLQMQNIHQHLHLRVVTVWLFQT